MSDAPTVVPLADRDGDECRLPNTMRILSNTGNDPRIASAAILGTALEAVGIANDAADKPWAQVLDNYFTGTWDLWIIGWGPDYLDPDNYWSPFAGSTNIGGDAYHTHYNNSALDAILLDARKELDEDLRRQLYVDAFALWVQDPNMAFLGQSAGVGVGATHVCPPAYDPIGGDHWFDWDKLPLVNGQYVGSCS